MSIKINPLIKLLQCSLVVGIWGISRPVLAAQWLYIADSESKRYYIDFDSLKGSDTIKTVWGRAKNPAEKVEWLAKFVVYCGQKKAAILEQIQYDNDGMVKSHYVTDSEQSAGGEYSDLIPGTVPSLYYNFVCDRITNKPQEPKPQESQATATQPQPQESKATTTQPKKPEPQPQESKATATQPKKPEPEPQESKATATQPKKPEPKPQESKTTAAQPKKPEPKPQESKTTAAQPKIQESKPTFTQPKTQESRPAITNLKTSENEYPKDACGDKETASEQYNVFVDYSPERLSSIQTKLCRDAFMIKRKDGKLSIQVASFIDKKNALKFAAFLLEKVGSAEVDSP